ncbi:DUF7344 domain-containing protein [Halobaculum sp. EA56]|uniref:DUF7344 domain-containing protein n=1 Tax=Halobaculum sp. EA56 TaxID=3421648 RepID=UPI003EBF2961
MSDGEAFETLANERRRLVVRRLMGRDSGVGLRELSRQVAAWENDKPVERVGSQERRRVYNALQQFHLSKLDDLGVVRYDAGRGVVEPTPALSELRPYLNATDRSGRRCLSPLATRAAGAALVAVALAGAALATASSATPLLAGVGVALVGAAVTVGWTVGDADPADRVPREGDS